ncbi:hypothetical protein SSU98_1499 [Streptococcus suis 98HAH33]|nr:hypothetical protein SSU05_1488 [Streptococcus suis 05ZYH33]ABP92657.1 hypothetical protein SSU98_1499 [Streptococcus suis 98HAH33]
MPDTGEFHSEKELQEALYHSLEVHQKVHHKTVALLHLEILHLHSEIFYSKQLMF